MSQEENTSKSNALKKSRVVKSTRMPQSTKRCPLSPWSWCRSQFKGKVNGYPPSSRRVNRLFKSHENLQIPVFQQNARKVKENPNTLKTHPKILSPWKRWKLANTHTLHLSIHHQQSHKFHVLLASATHLYEKDISLGRKWVSTSSTTSHMDGWLVSHVNAAPYKGLWIVNAPPYMESADLRSS